MKRKPGARVAAQTGSAAREPIAPEPELGDGPGDTDRIFSRPDGYHWVSLDGKREFGPFESYEDAQADMDPTADEEAGTSAAASMLEAEQDVGIADWIDPDTGEPAEGQCPPHLEQE